MEGVLLYGLLQRARQEAGVELGRGDARGGGRRRGSVASAPSLVLLFSPALHATGVLGKDGQFLDESGGGGSC